MSNHLKQYDVDYVEIYCPMAKALAYWHTQALGFVITAYAEGANTSSYLLESGNIRLVLTSAFPTGQTLIGNEVASFIAQQYCGVRRLALATDDVKETFGQSIDNGAIPSRFPETLSDEQGEVVEAAIRLYDNSEIVFTDRAGYNGVFKPGYKAFKKGTEKVAHFTEVDHIAAELRINEISYWTKYLTNTIGTQHVQSIQRSEDNRTGMILNINQSADGKLTLVMAEAETYLHKSKVQQNIDRFGPGIHHLAFRTEDIIQTTKVLTEKEVDFVSFPPSYYELLRGNADFEGIDIDTLQEHGILIDKEGDTYLLQKFIKPISDRPFFLYEIVQRVNGYNGFALKNINVLKKAEEIEVMKAETNVAV
jgi:4-hydroxyphenylpyruvate dioxygenase